MSANYIHELFNVRTDYWLGGDGGGTLEGMEVGLLKMNEGICYGLVITGKG